MNGQPSPNYDALRASSDRIQAAVTKFSLAGRVIYKHCGWPYTSKGLGERESRKEPMSYVALYSDCEECNLRHVEMTEKVYMVWFSALPFTCTPSPSPASTAEQELLDVLSTVMKYPEVHSQFPEFKTESLEDMIADIIKDCDETEASLQAQIDQMSRLEDEGLNSVSGVGVPAPLVSLLMAQENTRILMTEILTMESWSLGR